MDPQNLLFSEGIFCDIFPSINIHIHPTSVTSSSASIMLWDYVAEQQLSRVTIKASNHHDEQPTISLKHYHTHTKAHATMLLEWLLSFFNLLKIIIGHLRYLRKASLLLDQTKDQNTINKPKMAYSRDAFTRNYWETRERQERDKRDMKLRLMA